MAARLASFRGPSTPSSSPVKQARSTSTQSAKSTESTYHRKLRASLQELRVVCNTWDDLVRKDGLRAVRELIDARTDLEYVCLFPVPNTMIFDARCGSLMNFRLCVVVICSRSCLTESSRALASSVQSSHTWTNASWQSTWLYQSSCAVLLLPSDQSVPSASDGYTS